MCFQIQCLCRTGSLVNVTITITRKFLTILISNVAFGHQLSGAQWCGCILVFVGLLAKPVLNQAAHNASQGELPDPELKKDNATAAKQTNKRTNEGPGTPGSSGMRNAMRRRMREQTHE